MDQSARDTGDSEELEALFDSIVKANTGTSKPAAVEQPVANSSSAASATEMKPEMLMSEPARSMFSQIGQLTRQLHDTLRQLGLDKSLENVVSTIPDARDRLAYVATMTEKAAERALNSIELAQPIQDKLEQGATVLSGDWQKLMDNKLSVDEFKQLVTRTRTYLDDVPNQTRATHAQLLEIMMAQDFQDLTGQVIKKIVDMAQEMEGQLLSFLVEYHPVEKKVDGALMNGPVIKSDGRSDVVTSQQQVDDLLESLGF